MTNLFFIEKTVSMPLQYVQAYLPFPPVWTHIRPCASSLHATCLGQSSYCWGKTLCPKATWREQALLPLPLPGQSFTEGSQAGTWRQEQVVEECCFTGLLSLPSIPQDHSPRVAALTMDCVLSQQSLVKKMPHRLV